MFSSMRFLCIHFYPRPPRGGRLKPVKLKGNTIEFLSTPSARRATDEQFVLLLSHGISIHALREEGDPGLVRHHPYDHISIHALREEGDTTRLSSAESKRKFLSTPSARRATQCAMSYITTINISIHALREEGDGAAPHGKQSGRNFYPRPPRGGRRPDRHPGCHDHCISIHALREEGDYPSLMARIRSEISIHALREEGDEA